MGVPNFIRLGGRNINLDEVLTTSDVRVTVSATPYEEGPALRIDFIRQGHIILPGLNGDDFADAARNYQTTAGRPAVRND